MKPLEGKVAVVAGATRGAGRGMACMLGEAGATVYCTGRSVRGRPASGDRPETIEETAEMVTAFGGKGLFMQVDHTEEDQVKALFERVQTEQGRLDILVNDIWGGDALVEWGKPFWELDLAKGYTILDRAIRSHILTSRYGVPLMIPQNQGLIVEITDGDQEMNAHYRGNLFYDIAKTTPMRMAFGMAQELRDTHISVIALTPGFLRSEAMLDHFEVTEENWKDGIQKDPNFAESESPFYVGKGLAALAADPLQKRFSGKSLASWTLAREYGLKEADGSQPDWGVHAQKHVEPFWDKLKSLCETKIKTHELIFDKLNLTITGSLDTENGLVQIPFRVSFIEVFYSKPEEIAAKFVSHLDYFEKDQKT